MPSNVRCGGPSFPSITSFSPSVLCLQWVGRDAIPAGHCRAEKPVGAQEWRGAPGWHRGSLARCQQTLPSLPPGGVAPMPWVPQGAHPHGLPMASALQ